MEGKAAGSGRAHRTDPYRPLIRFDKQNPEVLKVPAPSAEPSGCGSDGHCCSVCVWIRTLEERAQRLFSTKGRSLEALDQALFAKNPKAKGPKK